MQPLAAIQEEVEHFHDALDMPVDPGIKPMVVALRYLGFNTTASCEGHLDWGFPYPWVEIDSGSPRLNRREKRRLRLLIKQFYKVRPAVHPLILQDIFGFRLQSVKWPRSAKKRKVQLLAADAELLAAYRREMDDFAHFLVAGDHLGA